MRAAIYIRMSDDSQENSPDRQRSLILPYCQKKGYEVVGEYLDPGMRGWDSSRPDFRRLLADAQDGRFEVIVFDEQSRLSRLDPIDFFYRVAGPLKDAGVILEAVDKGRFNWDDIAGLLIWTLGQHSASDESVRLGRRTATGMLKKAKEGMMFPGRPPYAYRYAKNTDGKRVGLVPDADHPERAEVVRHIFDWYLVDDLSLLAIVTRLNSSRIPSPRGRERWGKTTVHNILTNHAYAGSYVWGKVPQGRYFRCDGNEAVPTGRGAKGATRRPAKEWLIIPGQHEPIVAPDVFNRVQELLAANRIRTSPSRARNAYPMSQLLVCSHCGAPMYGTKRLSGGRWEPVYRCGSDMDKGTCAPRTAREQLVMDSVAEVLQTTFLDPANRDRLVSELERQAGQQAGQSEQIVKELRAKVSRLDTQITRATANLALLDPEFIATTQAQIRQWQRERSAAETEADRLTRQTPSNSVDNLVSKVGRLVELMRGANPALVRPLLREAIGRVELRFDTVEKAKVTRYPLVGGVVHLVGEDECADSASSGPIKVR